MTSEQYDSIVALLRRIVELLELQTIIPEDAEILQAACQHERAVDRGVMGDRPGANMFCPDCKQSFSRIEGNHG